MHRRGRAARILVRVAALVAVAAVVYLGVTFVQVWRASNRDGAREAEAIIVLGAAQYNGVPSPVLEARLDHALRLWNAGDAPVLVVTGGRQEGDRFTEATAGFNYLREHGVPEEAILKEVQGTSTWESLAAAARFLRDRDIQRVVLVSDGYHALRVEEIAEDLGLDASVSPTEEGGGVTSLAKESVAVALGRLIGYRRLVDLDHAVQDRGQ
jgi:uncharacterized SAM-binding protein YcdF (DUF218 family)